MKTVFICTLIILTLTSCSKKYEHLDTVKKVDINKYLGTWYEIARYEHRFEKDCKNVSANYELKEDNQIKVTNRCVNINTNKKTEANGIAYAKDTSNSKLKVSFFRPFYGDYWVLMLDKNYTYAVVGAPSRQYLWILSRTKVLNEDIKNKILKELPNKGFAIDKLIWTIQE